MIAMDDKVARLQIQERIQRAGSAEAESPTNVVSVQQLMMRHQRQSSVLSPFPNEATV